MNIKGDIQRKIQIKYLLRSMKFFHLLKIWAKILVKI